jgi:hypothetical protein
VSSAMIGSMSSRVAGLIVKPDAGSRRLFK